MSDLHRYDPTTWVETVWEAIALIHPQAMSEETTDDVKSAMAYIMEELGLEFDSNGDVVVERDLSYDPERRGYYESTVSD